MESRTFIPAEPQPDHSRDYHPPPLRPIADDPRDPSINPPPEPVHPTDETLAHVHAVLEQVVLAVETLAAQVPGGHGMAPNLARIRDGLAALFERAHKK